MLALFPPVMAPGTPGVGISVGGWFSLLTELGGVCRGLWGTGESLLFVSMSMSIVHSGGRSVLSGADHLYTVG